MYLFNLLRTSSSKSRTSIDQESKRCWEVRDRDDHEVPRRPLSRPIHEHESSADDTISPVLPLYPHPSTIIICFGSPRQQCPVSRIDIAPRVPSSPYQGAATTDVGRCRLHGSSSSRSSCCCNLERLQVLRQHED